MDLSGKKAIIRELYEDGLSQREIGERFGATQPEISRFMKNAGIETRHNGKWSEEEERLLDENYGDMPREKVEQLLPQRSWSAIKDKARKIGVAKSWEEHVQSEEVEEQLRKNAEENMIDVDFNNKSALSYVLGVIDGDGFHNRESTIGLENTSPLFIEKFAKKLDEIGLNPGRGSRRGKDTVWGCSKSLVAWCMERQGSRRFEWLEDSGNGWKYIEGRYESDGNIHPSGSPRICSYDGDAKKLIAKLLSSLGVECSIQQNNVWISISSADKFFNNINPVIRNPESHR